MAEAMFDHVGITVRDLGRSRAFYAAALAPLGIRELMEFEGAAAFGRDQPQFWIMQGDPAQSTPRTHVAFAATGRLEVDTFHRAALGAGGVDHGAPGLRPHYHENYYGAFVLDPDGHNIEAVCHRAP
jgi:catechol 2,3-dioxygenase-like lactoylglutathione lyase family enzyme